MLPMPQIILSAVSVSPTLIWCIIGIAVFLLLYMACGYVKAPPNKAYIVSGRARRKRYSSDVRDSVCRSSSG